jgi:hypothetical protein
MTYNTFDYYSLEHSTLVCNAHHALVRQYRSEELDAIRWYWKRATRKSAQLEYQTESVGPFTLHSGPLSSLPLPIVCIYLDSQVKTYMDRDALGDAVRHGVQSSVEHKRAISAARERELARRIGGGSLQGADVQMVAVEYNAHLLGGMIVNPGTKDETVGTIMQSSPGKATSIAALQANFALDADDPFLAKKEGEIVDLVRYFRAPDQVVKGILPPPLLERQMYRRAIHLVRALTISEVFAVTARWMARKGKRITTGVCETPNDDVKSLIEGRKVKTLEGTEIRVDGIPHRVLTSSTGTELYPDAYKDRPEGTSKIYTLYSFDFDEIASRSREYRALAIAAYEEGESNKSLQRAIRSESAP